MAFARQAYNDAVMTYNTAREVFPNNLVAGFGDFPVAELFQVTAPSSAKASRYSSSADHTLSRPSLARPHYGCWSARLICQTPRHR